MRVDRNNVGILISNQNRQSWLNASHDGARQSKPTVSAAHQPARHPVPIIVNPIYAAPISIVLAKHTRGLSTVPLVSWPLAAPFSAKCGYSSVSI